MNLAPCFKVLAAAATAFLVPTLRGEVEKPLGTFASSGALDPTIYDHPDLRGVLVRVSWADIEPTPGVFNFTKILQQADAAEAEGKKWSLAVIGGGPGSPDWLTDDLGAPSIGYSFRGEPGYVLPLFWDAGVQLRIDGLARALGGQFDGRAGLALVYVTQMTSNGIEGHLQGVTMSTLVAAGYTDQRWIDAGKQAARGFAAAFPNKPVAFEVHEVNGSEAVPMAIIDGLWNDPALDHRVGAAMWWISGKISYQPDLVAALTAFSGDIYGQVIGRSDQPERFEGGDYSSMFAQAKEIGIRYLEPWEFDFKTGPNGANGSWDGNLAEFNAWADVAYGSDAIRETRLRCQLADGGLQLGWEGIAGHTYKVECSGDLADWERLTEVTPAVDGPVTVSDPGIGGKTSGFYRLKLVGVSAPAP